MPKLSVYIITYNEADQIQAALQSVAWADEVVVADSNSTDATGSLAAAAGARVVQIPFNGFGTLRNQAMEACRHEWIFSLDADERCTPAVRQEIEGVLTSAAPADAYYVPRRNFFMGRQIRYAGFYPDYRQPQLFRKGMLSFTPDPVHEAYTINSARIGYLKHAIVQTPYRNLEQLQRKAMRYSSLGAQKLHQAGKKGSMAGALGHGLWAFIQMYFLKLGVLDGWPGFVIALGNFEGTFFKYAKLTEMQKATRREPLF